MTAEPKSKRGEAPLDAPFLTIDREHLSRQTMGDEALMREVLGLFASQIKDMQAALRAEGSRSKQRLGHTLKGAARGVGAFALATLAEDLETAPDDDAVVERLWREMEAVSLDISRSF